MYLTVYLACAGEELFDVVADALDAAGEPEGLGEPRTQRYTQHVLDGVWYMQEKHIGACRVFV